jgi:hypothetical protein
MLLILQGMIIAVLFSVSAVEAADFLVRLFTVLGWLYLWVGGGISAATGIELRAIPNSRIPTPRSHSQ